MNKTTAPEEAVKAMPERIYAKTHGASTDVISGQRGLIGGWNEHKRDGQTEFVRADLAAPHLAAVRVNSDQIEAARKAVEELANTQMNLPLEDWSRISSAILSALEPSPRDELMKQIREGTAYGFLNDGSQPEGNPDLDCPYCCGSGHKGDLS